MSSWNESPESGNGVRGYKDYSWIVYAISAALGVGGVTIVLLTN